MSFSTEAVIYNGHTEFFRHFFKRPETAMLFHSFGQNTLLATDHIPLRDVPKVLSGKKGQALLLGRVKVALEGLKQIKSLPKTVLFAGINPHAGESRSDRRRRRPYLRSLPKAGLGLPLPSPLRGLLQGTRFFFKRAPALLRPYWFLCITIKAWPILKRVLGP